ncbi:hypothetical protein [Pseudomonas sp. B21-053]|uniref:hypothetical protein n=1 Tax=Pseudomonas sp. B21-053 TaxID=2895493 RepID=UPI0022321EE7|nr:hypothetical protein [Pseudomonas sp. B21-053]UZE14747.1 hypothetical protein LOY68_14435 [Pseudomonas sp. B21-053]
MPYVVDSSVDMNTKIFRYMDLSKFLSLIHQKYLYFAKASSFEDRLEGMPTDLDGWLGSGVAEMLDIVVNNVLPSLSLNTSPEERARREVEHDAAQERFKNRTINTVFGPQRIEDYSHYSSIFEAVSHWVDISCWHMDVGAPESMAMWKIYGAGSAAVCVVSSVGDVIRAMSIPQDIKLIVDKVSYLNFESDYVGIDNPLSVFFHKNGWYEFEKELRFVIHQSSNLDPRRERGGYGTSIEIDPGLLIKRVMVSPASSGWFLDLVSLIVKEAGLKVDVAKSKIPLR